MTLPKRPPEWTSLLANLGSPARLIQIVQSVSEPTVQGKYLHWDKLRFYAPPDDLGVEEWWLGLKINRRALAITLPLRDGAGQPFRFAPIAPMPERMHWLDNSVGETRRFPGTAKTVDGVPIHLDRSLIEEAFTSSQLEGAATTRERAYEMICRDRPPRSRGDWMVLNNFRTMEHILGLRDEPLTKELVFELQSEVTAGTLDDEGSAGRFRTTGEYRVVGDPFGEIIYHEPPDSRQLAERMELMCAFANGELPGEFIHPAIRSMILHFWLAYDHPFVDGNGRTARALFYWSMLRHGYWMFEYASISTVILQGPMRYQRAFLETETDENDLTYFLVYHAEIIARAVDELAAFTLRKSHKLREARAELRDLPGLNRRQQVALIESLAHPLESMTVESHKRVHDVVTQTARTDLLDLVSRGLFRMEKRGKAFHFVPVEGLDSMVRRPRA